ncbi:MAG: UTP--glucose-1-phosphate uridylyltransferase [Candidatus Sericytochromatia bacterium]
MAIKTPSENTFQTLQAAFLSGELNPERIRLEATVTPPAAEDLHDLETLSASERQTLAQLGREAVARHEVAAVVLAGGMATRFDFDAPKGLYPILDGHHFLELKVRALCGQGIPLWIMTSFYTHDAIVAELEAKDWFGHRDQIVLFEQFRLPRMTPAGEIRRVNGEIDYATAGHGDFVPAMQAAHLLAPFVSGGGKYLLFSNIDNLGASFDPVLLGLHIQNGVEMSIEVADKAPGDKGGAPARVDGKLQLVEEFLFPADFEQDRITVFNTASYIFSAQALQREFELPWYVVRKSVGGEAVLQLEHLAGDLSRELRICCLHVARDERFLPVKQRSDEALVEPLIRRKYAHLLES